MTGNRNGRSIFWKIYLTVLIAALLILAVFLVVTGFRLKAYEKSQPDNIAEQIFTEKIKNSSAEKIAELIYADGLTDEGKTLLVGEISDILNRGELSIGKIASVTQEDSKEYLISAGEAPLVSFTLKKTPGSDKKKLFGILSLRYADYELTGFKNEIEGSTAENFIVPTSEESTITVTAPSSYTVTVNGTALTEQNITEKDIPSDTVLYAPEGFALPTLTKYQVSCDTQNIQITASAPNGAKADAEFDSLTSTYICPYIYDGNLQVLYEQTVLECAKIYDSYFQGDTQFYMLSYYLDVNSALYNQIRLAALPMSSIAHNGIDFSDDGTYEYISWSDEIFSCRVRFNRILHTAGQDVSEQVDRTFFFKISGEDILIFNAYDMN